MDYRVVVTEEAEEDFESVYSISSFHKEKSSSGDKCA